MASDATIDSLEQWPLELRADLEKGRGNGCVTTALPSETDPVRVWRPHVPAGDNALAEAINGLFKAEVIHRRGAWRSFDAVEFAALEWVDWLDTRRLLEPIENLPPAEAEARYVAQTDVQASAASSKPNGLRETRCGSVRFRAATMEMAEPWRRVERVDISARAILHINTRSAGAEAPNPIRTSRLFLRSEDPTLVRSSTAPA